MKALVYTDTLEVTYRDEPEPDPAAGAKCKIVKRQFYSPERRNNVPADLYE